MENSVCRPGALPRDPTGGLTAAPDPQLGGGILSQNPWTPSL